MNLDLKLILIINKKYNIFIIIFIINIIANKLNI